MKYILIISVILLINLTQNYSQLKDSNNLIVNGLEVMPGYLNEGNSLTGPVVGYSFKSKIINYGINYEYAFAQNNTGIFTGGISGKFNSSNEDILDNTAKLKTVNISFGLQCNFNFNRLRARSVIPFAGILMGYNYAVTKYEFNDNIVNPLFPETKKHSLYFFGKAGARFFISRSIALTLSAGTGNIDKSMLELAFDYKF